MRTDYSYHTVEAGITAIQSILKRTGKIRPVQGVEQNYERSLAKLFRVAGTYLRVSYPFLGDTYAAYDPLFDQFKDVEAPYAALKKRKKFCKDFDDYIALAAEECGTYRDTTGDMKIWWRHLVENDSYLGQIDKPFFGLLCDVERYAGAYYDHFRATESHLFDEDGFLKPRSILNDEPSPADSSVFRIIRYAEHG